MNQTVTEVKDIIKNRRLQLGLSYSELGKMCGVDKTTAWKWELGKIENMKRDKMVLLSKALDISPLVLLGIEEYVPNHPSKSGNDDKIPVYQEIVGNQLKQAIANIDNPYPHEKVKRLPGYARFCPDCGCISSFYLENILKVE